MKKPRHIFIVGAGRSGTSLLQAIIAAHPEILSKQEDQYLRNILYGFSTLSEPMIRKEREEKVLKYYDQFIDNRVGKTTYLDKDPRLIEHADRLLSDFSDSVVIEIYRHPIKVLRSRQAAEWSKGRSLITHVLTTYLHQSLGRYWSKTLDAGYFRINYEDLLTDFEGTVKPLMHNIGLLFSEHQNNYHISSSMLVREEEKSWKKNIEKPLLVNKAFFSEDDISHLEKILLGVFYKRIGTTYVPRHFYLVSKFWLAFRK